MAKNCRTLALVLGLLLAASSVRAAGPEFTVWGHVTYDSASGHPVPGVIVHCNTVVGGSQDGTPPGHPGIDGYYVLKFTRVAEQLRIYLEVPADMTVIGNSSCAPCGPWTVNLVVCNIPTGQAEYSIGPINFFVRYLAPPTPTRTPTATTPTITLTATNTPTITPYLLPTAKPEGRPTPDSFLGVAQRKLEQTDEFLAIFRYMAYLLAGALAGAGYITVQSRRS